MKIIVASKNEGKLHAVRAVFPHAEVVAQAAESQVSSKPINQETYLGAYNRVCNIQSHADLVVAIEGGYFVVDGKFYIADVACIKDGKGVRFGQSDLYEISKNMYDCIVANISLNEIILGLHKFEGTYAQYKERYGVIGFLSGQTIERAHGSIQALRDATNATYHNGNSYKFCGKNVVQFENALFTKLDAACKKVLESTKEK